MGEIYSTAVGQGFVGLLFVLLVIGSTIMLFKHYLPLISNESKVVALTNSNNDLADKIAELNMTIIRMMSEQDKRISLIELEIAYIKAKLEKEIEC
jgi:hypothetical protein